MLRALMLILAMAVAGAAQSSAQFGSGDNSSPPSLALAALQNRGDFNASTHRSTQAEVSIAVNPTDASNLVAAAMNLAGEGGILVMTSLDQGVTWNTVFMPVSTGAIYHADPWVAFDSAGVVYLAHIPVASGNEPIGIEVTRSFDKGLSWDPSQRISANRGNDDKLVVEVDRSTASPYRDRAYIAWKWPSRGVYVSTGRDGSFGPPVRIDDAVISGLDLAFQADGTAYLAANSGARGIVAWRSTDGGASWSRLPDPSATRAGWYTSGPAFCERMSLVHATIDADVSGGPNHGRLYVSWSDTSQASPGQCGDLCQAGPCDTDVYLVRSDDNGDTWTDPVVVHEEELGGADQFMPWLDVDDTTGHVIVGYKDTRVDSTRREAAFYVSRSTDGGVSWEPSHSLASAAGRAFTNFQYGDYQSLATAGPWIYGAWADYRDPLQNAAEIFVGRARSKGRPGAWQLGYPPGGRRLFWSGRLRGRQQLDLYLWVWNPETRENVWIDAEGSPWARPRPVTTVAARRKGKIDIRLDADVWTRIQTQWPGWVLLGQVFTDSSDPATGGAVHSSRLKIPLPR
ncbi:MAG: hypothetical protein GKS06_03150 [Acidobacteria bacterium]|nr:hypothetical protein [Acidobacteriota bacterium]